MPDVAVIMNDMFMDGSLTPAPLEMQVVVAVRYRTQYFFKGSTTEPMDE